jgi:hypothetical protein
MITPPRESAPEPDLHHKLATVLASGQPAHRRRAAELAEAIEVLWEAHLHDPYLTRNDGD